MINDKKLQFYYNKLALNKKCMQLCDALVWL